MVKIIAMNHNTLHSNIRERCDEGSGRDTVNWESGQTERNIKWVSFKYRFKNTHVEGRSLHSVRVQTKNTYMTSRGRKRPHNVVGVNRMKSFFFFLLN